MATKYTADALKKMTAVQLREAAKAWGVAAGGKTAPDLIREVLAKQNGGKTPASAANTKVPTKPAAPAKPAPKAPAPPAKPAAPAPKAPPAAPAKAAPAAKAPAAPAPKAPTAPAPKAPPAKPAPAAKTPPAAPAAAKPASSDVAAKFQTMLDAKLKPITSAIATLQADMDELKALAAAGGVEEQAPAEEQVEEAAPEGEEQAEVTEEVEITQESIEAMKLPDLLALAEQFGIDATGAEKSERVLKARVLKWLADQAEATQSETPAEGEIDTSWMVEGTPCIFNHGDAAHSGFLMGTFSEDGTKAIVFEQDPQDPETGLEYEVPLADVFPEDAVAEGEQAAE